MTELFIDGISVVLPKEFSVQVKFENPFITKNGEYTYDVMLELTNPTNAGLYKHLNRLNNIQEIEEKRSALLVSDNRVYCNGTEIITEWTHDSVTLQIASGNSELNYFIGGDLMISSLIKMRSTLPGFDVGVASGVKDYLRYVQHTYPAVDYCLAPAVDSSAGEIDNNWCMDMSDFAGNPSSRDFVTVIPQPYLCAYIKEIVNALGYTINSNQLENTVFKDLYICHTEKTIEWCKMLPGWSVTDFLTEVEKLLNVVFITNNKRKTVQVVLKSTFYAGCKPSHVKQVTDVYEAEIDDSNDIDDPTFATVEYKFTDCDFWRWASLSDAVKNKAIYDTIPASFTGSNGYPRLTEWFSSSEHKRTDTIYKDEKDNREYISLVSSDSTNLEYSMVNQFGKLKRDNSEKTIELNIVPSAFDMAEINGYESKRTTKYKVYIPVIVGASTESEKKETLVEMIRNNSSESSESKKAISLAFFSGMSTIVVFNRVPYKYPLPYVDEYTKYVNNRGQVINPTNSVGGSLRLATLDKLLYQGGYDIDYTRGITVYSYDPNLYDVRSIFEISNKRYICQDMEFTIDVNGRKGAWKGTYYPIRISDTEAESRWILTDGKWRDGGVWMDNGRWMDE